MLIDCVVFKERLIINSTINNIKKRDSLLVNSIEFKENKTKNAIWQHKQYNKPLYFSTIASPKSLYYIFKNNHTIYTKQFKTRFIEYDFCISVFNHNPVTPAITSLSKILSPKYLRFNL